ncbi:hypothetical protein D3C71_1942860 [compost metagenome]
MVDVRLLVPEYAIELRLCIQVSVKGQPDSIGHISRLLRRRADLDDFTDHLKGCREIWIKYIIAFLPALEQNNICPGGVITRCVQRNRRDIQLISIEECVSIFQGIRKLVIHQRQPGL